MVGFHLTDSATPTPAFAPVFQLRFLQKELEIFMSLN